LIHTKKILFTLLFSFVVLCSLNSQDNPVEKRSEVGVDEKLGTTIPLDLSFLDEYGRPVSLRSLVTKPTIFTLVYYRCPGICSPLLSGVASVVDKMDLEPGKDYNIVTISFNPKEDYIMASEKKANYLNGMKKKIPTESWRFLTGDSASIAKITDAIGFRYQKQGEDFIHGAVITAVSPKGQIARYLYGTDFLPLDLKLAITEASEGRTGPTINKLLKLCFSYDPDARKYVLDVTRIAGGGILLILVGFVLMLTLKKKKNNKNNLPAENGHNSPDGKGSIQNG
jgi:protein SCO1